MTVALLPVLGILKCLEGVRTKGPSPLRTTLEGLAPSLETGPLSARGSSSTTAVTLARSGTAIPGRARRIILFDGCSGTLTEQVDSGSAVATSTRRLGTVPILEVFITFVKGVGEGRGITGLSLNVTDVGPGCAGIGDSRFIGRSSCLDFRGLRALSFVGY